MKSERKALGIWIGIVGVLWFLALMAPPTGTGPEWTMTESVVVLLAAAVIRVVVIPRFTVVPGRFQFLLEQLVGGVDYLAGAVRAFGGKCAGFARRIARAVAAAARFVGSRKRAFAVWAAILAVLLALLAVVPAAGGHEDVQEAMRDAVLHDVNRISLFGIKDVNPGLIAAMTVSGALLLAAALIRLFAVPRFSPVPGKLQLALEEIVSLLDGLANVRDARNPGRITFVGAYIFAAGVYIFTGTLFELLGLQAVTAQGASITLPAPLSDINAAICMGCLSYLVIFAGGVAHAGLRGAKATIKEFSLPISMSFRLFGALLSGLLVTDLVYHYAALSYGIPVVVGVIFTLLHALVQAYVLTMLVGLYYHEVSEG